MVDCIKDKLDKVETIHFHSNNYSAFLSHEDLLTFLPNLKTLHNKRACSIQDKWLHNHYPKLERLMLNNPEEILTDTVGIFFDKNPQLQSFQTDHRFLLKNSDTFLKSNMKLDVLSIRYELDDGLNGVCSLLSKLYDNGFYKRLEFDSGASKIPQDGINRIGRLGGLEKWSGCFEGITVIPAVANLKKLRICDASLTKIDLDAMIDSFPNLHQVRLYEASNNKLLPFIRRLPKLSELSVRHFFAENGHEIDLPTLNGARKQLSKPSKLTIYVEENVYLGTKMATKNLYVDHNLIEVKRVGNIQEDFFADR
ncbi:uncharacterized protein LOC129580229 [Sitodiplosis mosellana]|uniref:uncharacterized protein LOC129580229 n=1 Tax=Sitodiplosis mosellana TaxID=263140 RepID=UPI00244412D1|nr:uncharacterized protein LOC129580229 [Sitodiplosis mosellana]